PAHIFDLHRFPLKWRATCVKNQRNRGTCVAFGITAAVETKIAVNHNRWTNLSEQRLYYWAKAPTKHGDGLNTSGVMDSMVSSAFTYPWEHNWDYNPSPSRDSVGDPAYYVNSCVGYSAEHCSDTSHQGDKVCSSFLGLMFCSTDGSAVPASGFQMKNRLHLWSYGAVGGSALGRLFLALSHPLVISLPVTPTFDQAAGNGIMTYAGAGEDNRGGHALAVMGFVDNENLPGGYPAGAGGGYFIVKNSWGQCWKDGGYVYIPYDWVHTYGYALTAVSQVN
ncbi:MAG: C1 family peptidase, partial [Myxococcales bacterium]|nr:C1 family peptidase [Myxococcales bacterium]